MTAKPPPQSNPTPLRGKPLASAPSYRLILLAGHKIFTPRAESFANSKGHTLHCQKVVVRG
jgi:hypothetical protein